MKPKVVLISLCFVLLFGGGCNNIPPKKTTKARHKERIPFPYESTFTKDTLYFVWEKQCCDYHVSYYSEREKGIIFKSPYNSFIFENGSISDTLIIKNLQGYKVNSFKPIEMDSIDNQWRNKNKAALLNIFGGYTYYGTDYDRNTMYITYLIEICDDKKKFIIYPVSWYYPPEIE